jgi:RNA polymerase sigma-70 factor (ECF subfamily)
VRTAAQARHYRLMSAQEVLGVATQAEQLRPPAGLRTAPEPPRRNSIESSSDGELLTRTGKGDRQAFEELYRRFARPVLGFALKRLRDRGRAEDATQETFAAIWRSASSYRPERGPGASWLYAVARNAIIDQTRIRVAPPAEAPDLPSDEPGPAEHVESEWTSWRVHRALEELPEPQRTVIDLAYRAELSQSEIATRLDIPLGTVKTRTRLALTRLAALLEHEELQPTTTTRRSSR